MYTFFRDIPAPLVDVWENLSFFCNSGAALPEIRQPVLSENRVQAAFSLLKSFAKTIKQPEHLIPRYSGCFLQRSI